MSVPETSRLGRRASVSALTWLAAVTSITAAAQAQVRTQFDVRSPMRDGAELSADLWTPAADGPFPTILVRTPYLKTMTIGNFSLSGLGRYFAERGYAVMIQDVRGRGDSDGEFQFYFQESKDGYDTIEWIASQSWSNGNVCMMGVSYLGAVQWLAAKARPPHLKCIAPTAASGQYMHELPYRGGAWTMHWSLDWINGTSGRNQQDNNTNGIDWESIFQHRPLLTMDEVMGRKMPLYRDFLNNNVLNDYWKSIQLSADDFRRLDLPVLHVTGWFDGDQPGALYQWAGMADHSPARVQQYLIVGPWEHAETFIGGTLKVGEIELPGSSIIDNKAVHLEFFDRYLKGTAPSFDYPRARLFFTGTNEWRDFDQYPPAHMEPTPFYIHSGGRANSLAGDGHIDSTAPRDEPPDRFTYDPKHPAPVAVDRVMFGGDRRPIQRRDDVLVYTTDALQAPVEIAGPVYVELYAATDARDTDFTANIMDVYPDGRAVKLGAVATGIIRARYRKGLDRTELLTPGQVERYEIDLGHIAHVFQPGHRIRIDVSSSAYPFFNPNQNTGNPVATDTEWRIAQQTIYHDAAHPSRLVLPVLRREVIPE